MLTVSSCANSLVQHSVSRPIGLYSFSLFFLCAFIVMYVLYLFGQFSYRIWATLSELNWLIDWLIQYNKNSMCLEVNAMWNIVCGIYNYGYAFVQRRHAVHQRQTQPVREDSVRLQWDCQSLESSSLLPWSSSWSSSLIVMTLITEHTTHITGYATVTETMSALAAAVPYRKNGAVFTNACHVW